MIHSNSKVKDDESKSYLSNYKENQDHLIKYIQSRKEMSRQQYFLHKLVQGLRWETSKGMQIGDFGCGGGWQTYHLAGQFDILGADLFDIHYKSLELAKGNLQSSNIECNFYHENIEEPKYIQKDKYDLGISLMTLSWVNNPSIFLRNMLNSIKSNGYLILSTLVNRNHPDVDLEVIQRDNKLGLEKKCTIFGESTIREYLTKSEIKCSQEFHEFNIDIDLEIPEEKGTGTYTMKLENGVNLEISGGALFPWSFIVIKKN